jgi:hypothetical protein
MNRLASAVLASAFFAATGGIAMAANAPAGAGPASPANAPAAASGSTAAPAAKISGTRDTPRMTHALNLLEAQGYGDFHDFKSDGKNFDATVTRNGKQVTVTVDPDSDQVTVQS